MYRSGNFSAMATPQQAVQHAPTVAQCQADRALWVAKLERDFANDTMYETVQAWESEMNQCEDVDPQNGQKYMTRGVKR